MLTYFVLPTSTSDLVVIVNNVLLWGDGSFTDLIKICLAVLFGWLILRYILTQFKAK